MCGDCANKNDASIVCEHAEKALATTPGRSIEYEYVAEYLRSLFDSLDMRQVAFDRWNFKHLRPWLQKAGFSESELERFVEFGQGYASMSPALRDLALFNTGIDTMLRSSDILKLRVIDVCDHTGAIVEELPIRQKKTNEPHVVQLLQPSREAIKAWIELAGKTHDHFLFTSLSNRNHGEPITREQYANLVKKWADYARLDPRRHSTHSMRRTKSAAVYAATKNLAVCRELLGHKNIGSTAHYLGIDKREALDIAKKSRCSHERL
jgi:integrase